MCSPVLFETNFIGLIDLNSDLSFFNRYDDYYYYGPPHMPPQQEVGVEAEVVMDVLRLLRI